MQFGFVCFRNYLQLICGNITLLVVTAAVLLVLRPISTQLVIVSMSQWGE